MTAHASTTVIRGGTVWTGEDAATTRANHDVVIEDGRIAEVVCNYEGSADLEIDAENCLVMPGLINAHTHAGSTPTARGLAEDLELPSAGAFYHSLIPLLGLGYSELTPAEFSAIMEWDAAAMLLGGATTVVEENFGGADIWLAIVERLGFRSYVGLTYPGNVAAIGFVEDGKVVKADPGDVAGGLQRNLEFHDRHHGSFGDRLRVHLSPHAPDTVPEEVMRETAREAEARDITIHLHLAQHLSELETIADRSGTTPVKYLQRIGVLGPRVLATHVTYTEESDWAIFAESGATAIHSAYRKAKEGLTSPFYEFLVRGGNVGLATDSFSHDLLSDLGMAALFGKVREHSVGRPKATDVVWACTRGSAKALRRPDLGVLTPGARGDVIVLDQSNAFTFPVFDPLRALVYYSHGSDLRHSLVDGRPVVSDGKVVGMDVPGLRQRVEQACRRLWEIAADRGVLPGVPVARGDG